MLKKVSLSGILIIICLSIFSQANFKFGKISDEHMNSTVCPIDSGAAAYVIFDVCNTFFNYTDNSGFSWTRDRHYRIKILKSSAYDQANISIPLYQSVRGKEFVTGLKAATYNLENGKVESYKIKGGDAFMEETSENFYRYKFTLPNVKEGSIIEINYKLISEFPSYLRDWYFQDEIPVLHSEIHLKIPEFFTYHENMKGYHPLADINRTSESASVTLSSGGASQPQSVRYIENVKHFTAKNIPALKEEAYVDDMDNYRSMIEFELERIKFGTEVTNYTTDWEAVNARFLQPGYFGSNLGKTGFARDDLKILQEQFSDPFELMTGIYQHVQNTIKWNGETGFSFSNDLRKSYFEGSGSSTDINFILINLLNEAGIEAYPLALSTRANGWILPTYPTMDKFNHVVAYCKIGESSYLLDASDRYCPPGVLPSMCLNGRGRIIDETHSSWVDIKPLSSYETLLMYDVNIDQSGNVSGKININNKGYAAIGFRHYREDFADEEKMIEDVEEDNPGMIIHDYTLGGLDNNYGPVDCEYHVEIQNKTEFMGDMITFNPLFYERIGENPFKLDERKFPVNYTYPRSYKQMFKIRIPEGFEVESIPEAMNLVLPDKSCSFMYNAVQMGDLISVTVMMDVKKDVFQSAEYPNLKEFYNLVVAKEAEIVVLKKKS